jgi:malonyl-CoA/methylmalonyl-CoA synthetase
MIEIINRAQNSFNKTAIIDQGQSYSYRELIVNSGQLSLKLLGNNSDLNERRVAFMVSPGFKYVVVQWAIWQAGGVAVPLCVTYPLPSLQYVIENTEADIIVVSAEFEPLLTPLATELGIRLIVYSGQNNENIETVNLPNIDENRRAMILFTSGTTNLPKGVVTTQANIEAQISCLIEAWQWTDKDHTLCVLPLHHVHGIINVVSCALWAGATVEFLHNFSENAVFEAFMKGRINVFMAVPTIYFKLIAFFEKQNLQYQYQITQILTNFRLMVSGSAALPVTVMEKWKCISNHTLLERYGMTEIGMAIGNPYTGIRKAGYIGQPLPGVEIRLADESNQTIKNHEAGEIQVKGKSVFTEYWRKPDATKNTFTNDGWFKTGDIAIVEDGYFKILGRDSIDIIKSGGYKISAIEIEEILRTHPQISDCAVVGIPDDEWGELVVAVININDKALILNDLNIFMKEKLPNYKCPKKYKILAELPRNAMGKVVKNDLKQLFF